MPQKTRPLVVAVAGIGLAAALVASGCSHGAQFVAGQSTTASPGARGAAAASGGAGAPGASSSPGATPGTPKLPGTSSPRNGGKPPAGGSGGSSGSSGSTASGDGTVKCDVTGLELMHWLRLDGAMYSALGSPQKFGQPVCIPDYAEARSTSAPNGAERVRVLFHYAKATDSWTPIAAGSAVDCSAIVSKAQAKLLPGCVTR